MHSYYYIIRAWRDKMNSDTDRAVTLQVQTTLSNLMILFLVMRQQKPQTLLLTIKCLTEETALSAI